MGRFGVSLIGGTDNLVFWTSVWSVVHYGCVVELVSLVDLFMVLVVETV